MKQTLQLQNNAINMNALGAFMEYAVLYFLLVSPVDSSSMLCYGPLRRFLILLNITEK